MLVVSRHRLLSPERTPAAGRPSRRPLLRLAAIALWARTAFVLLFVPLPLLVAAALFAAVVRLSPWLLALAAQLGGALAAPTRWAGCSWACGRGGARLVRLAAAAVGAHDVPGRGSRASAAFASRGAFVAAARAARRPIDFRPRRGRAGAPAPVARSLPGRRSACSCGRAFHQRRPHRRADPTSAHADPANLGFDRRWPRSFDNYQAAGLLARGLLACTLLPLSILLLRRAALARTTRASLRWFWIYLGALVAGRRAARSLAAPLAERALHRESRAVPARHSPRPCSSLGLLQGLGIFALASRRYAECFAPRRVRHRLHRSFLFFAGRQPQLMTTCMFGGALISLMLVLFVGVVRYARSHP